MAKLRGCMAVLLALPAACGHPAAGGAEAPAVDDQSGNDVQQYQMPAAQVWAATEAAMAEDDAVVEHRRAFPDGGEIVARRLLDRRVRATVTAAESDAARVAISISPPDSALAGMIQRRIAERLSLEKAKSDLFGESSVETVYSRSLAASIAAAEETCLALDLEIVGRTTGNGHARVDARDRQARPFRFSFGRIREQDEETAVVFTAVVGEEEDTLEHLRREFELHLFPARD